IGNAQLRRTNFAAAGDFQRKCQNGSHAAEGAPLIPRKQINCDSSKMLSPGVSKLSISKVGMSSLREQEMCIIRKVLDDHRSQTKLLNE
ncbi:hypothetical protein AVEN_31201-1, partial [Araneus ventricosus]